ncbi:MAG: NADH-quinone oxidoreductase subunit L [Chloroflexi bacterium]|nr:NADH-quinone oxidoreductase subunit L [Chloroflexota bacterium]
MTALSLLLVPLGAAGVLVLLRGKPSALGPVGVAALLATLALGAWAAVSEPTLGWDWSPAIHTGLAVEGFSRVMVVLVPAIAAPIFVYAAATEEEGRLRLLALMLVFTGAMLLLVTAADFLMLLIAWELVGAISWALIGHGWRDTENARSAAQAFVTTRVGDLGLYIAAGALFAATGSFSLAAVGGAGGWEVDVIAGGVLLAAAAKSAQVPFSPWLFAAMAGPTPVSALLHSATLVAAGAYLLIRIAPDLDAAGWFLPAVAATGLVTALAGGIVASVQQHAKRALAGSTSAQYGLMFVAVGASSTAAAGGQLVTHAAFKSLLFLGAGVYIHASGSPTLGGAPLGRALPRIAAFSAVGVLALAAVPPLGGAWTKEEIVAAAVDESAWLGAGLFAAGFLTALYASRYQVLTFFGPGGPRHAAELRHRPGTFEIGSIAALAAFTLALSLLWVPGAATVVEDATGGHLAPSAWWEPVASIASIALGFGLVWAIWRRGALTTLGLPVRLREAAGDWLGLPTATRLFVVAPVMVLSRLLARLDDRVVDAGVRGVGWLAAAISRLFSLRVEWSIDGLVRGAAAGTWRAAVGSRLADEVGVDGAVEGAARSVGFGGEQSRRLQTGLAHHYYVIAAVGLAATVGALAAFGLAKGS